jgi:hypothetical protein
MAMFSLPPPGHFFKYGRFVFWAQCGVICLEDQYTGELHTQSIRDFIERAMILRIYLNRHMYKYADERNRDDNYVWDARRCAREAKAQGDPLDPVAVETMLRQRRRVFLYMGEGSGRVVYLNCTTAAESPERAKDLPARQLPARFVTVDPPTPGTWTTYPAQEALHAATA